MAPLHVVEPRAERQQAIGGSLVGVGHQPDLRGRLSHPLGILAIVGEARDGMPGHGPRKFPVALLSQPLGAGMAVTHALERMLGVEGLVDVMEESGCLHGRAVE
ncbi:hypothetical protein BH20CHL6_BH20CHL6_13820 [soil metagenome]